MGVSAAYAVMAAASVYSAAESADTNRRGRNAATQARENAQRTEAAATRETNKVNAKAPDVNALMAANALGAKGGAGSTMLTGPQGVDPSTLTLGKKTLLGG